MKVIKTAVLAALLGLAGPSLAMTSVETATDSEDVALGTSAAAFSADVIDSAESAESVPPEGFVPIEMTQSSMEDLEWQAEIAQQVHESKKEAYLRILAGPAVQLRHPGTIAALLRFKQVYQELDALLEKRALKPQNTEEYRALLFQIIETKKRESQAFVELVMVKMQEIALAQMREGESKPQP